MANTPDDAVVDEDISDRFKDVIIQLGCNCSCSYMEASVMSIHLYGHLDALLREHTRSPSLTLG